MQNWPYFVRFLRYHYEVNIQTLLQGLLTFLNGTIIPFFMALAFLVFIWNTVRYFIIGGANEDDQEKARSLATWGIMAFVIMVSLLGIVKLLVSGLGFGSPAPITPDYMQSKNTNFPDNDSGPGSNIFPSGLGE